MSEKASSLMASMTGGDGGAGDDLFGDIPIDDPVPAPLEAPAPNSNSDSIYHDPMPEQQPEQQQQQQQQQYPQPEAPQQPMANAPNITYADASASNPAPDMTQSTPVLPSAPVPAPVPAPATSQSLLMSSGLLGMAGGGGGGSSDEKKAASGGGGGLFDDIDEEEETKVKAAAAAAAAAAEEQRQQQEAAAAATALAEKQRLEQEEQQRQQQQMQQQQMQQNQQQQPNQHQQQPNQQQMQPNQQQPNQQYSMEDRMQGMHLNNNNQNNWQTNSYMQQSQQQQMQPNNGQAGQMTNQQQQQQQPGMQPGGDGGMGGRNNQMQQHPGIQPGMQQQQQPGMQQQQQQPPVPIQISAPGVMYREHPGLDSSMSPQGGPGGAMSPNNNNGGMNNSMNNPTSPNRFFQPSTQGVPTAGMHNSAMSPNQHQQSNSPYGMQGMPHHQQQQQQVMMPSQPISITKPPDVPTYYGKVTINDPMLLQAPSKLFSMVAAPPHWSYQITTQILGQPPSVWMVRRRFSHVVALEDRLRQECPGAILPPRPDKHVSRAIEEASTNQSAEFAWQRAAELDAYLNALASHPEVFPSQSLKMFLGLQDDMGTAWPEVSANAFTRVSALGAAAVAKGQETSITGFFGTAAPSSTTPGQSSGGVMSNVMGSVASSVGVGDLTEAVTEDSAELLALASSESVRMGAVLQAVPKLDGAVTLLREQGEVAGAVGMELNRLAKEVMTQGDRELAMPLEILSNGLLRYGRRTKRLGQEVGQATMASYQLHYKLCRYEKLAWNDRRTFLGKRSKERLKADKRAQQMMGYQQQHQSGYNGGYGQQNPQFNNGGNQMNSMMSNAAMSDNMAASALQECDVVGERLKREVNRISYSRRMDYAKSIKVIASYMKEAATERVAIWESTRDTFLQTFPDYQNDNAEWTSVAPDRPQHMQQAPPQMGGMNMNNSYMDQQQQQQPGMMSQSYQQPATQQQPQQQPQVYASMMGNAMPGPAPVYQQQQS